jgi:hypothetical protein
MPLALFEKLRAEAAKGSRSINSELVGRIERSLTLSSNDEDIRLIFEALDRLSARNPQVVYSFGINFGVQQELRPAEIKNGHWTLAPEPTIDEAVILCKPTPLS